MDPFRGFDGKFFPSEYGATIDMGEEFNLLSDEEKLRVIREVLTAVMSDNAPNPDPPGDPAAQQYAEMMRTTQKYLADNVKKAFGITPDGKLMRHEGANPENNPFYGAFAFGPQRGEDRAFGMFPTKDFRFARHCVVRKPSRLRDVNDMTGTWFADPSIPIFGGTKPRPSYGKFSRPFTQGQPKQPEPSQQKAQYQPNQREPSHPDYQNWQPTQQKSQEQYQPTQRAPPRSDYQNWQSTQQTQEQYQPTQRKPSHPDYQNWQPTQQKSQEQYQPTQRAPPRPDYQNWQPTQQTQEQYQPTQRAPPRPDHQNWQPTQQTQEQYQPTQREPPHRDNQNWQPQQEQTQEQFKQPNHEALPTKKKLWQATQQEQTQEQKEPAHHEPAPQTKKKWKKSLKTKKKLRQRAQKESPLCPTPQEQQFWPTPEEANQQALEQFWPTPEEASRPTRKHYRPASKESSRSQKFKPQEPTLEQTPQTQEVTTQPQQFWQPTGQENHPQQHVPRSTQQTPYMAPQHWQSQDQPPQEQFWQQNPSHPTEQLWLNHQNPSQHPTQQEQAQDKYRVVTYFVDPPYSSVPTMIPLADPVTPQIAPLIPIITPYLVQVVTQVPPNEKP